MLIRENIVYIAVFITVPDRKEAEKIAHGLIKSKLAACVNMIGGVESLFRWEGKVDRAEEVLLIVKSRKSKFKKLMTFVKSVHSYSVPEIIALPITAGNKDYLTWIDESVR